MKQYNTRNQKGVLTHIPVFLLVFFLFGVFFVFCFLVVVFVCCLYYFWFCFVLLVFFIIFGGFLVMFSVFFWRNFFSETSLMVFPLYL